MSTAGSAISGVERDFKKATRLLALLVASILAAKQLGGLDLPLHVTFNFDEGETLVSQSSGDPDLLSGGLMEKPSTLRLTRKLKAALEARAEKERLSSSEVIRRVLEGELLAAPKVVTPLAAPESHSSEALDPLRAQLEEVRRENALLSDLLRELRAESDRRAAGQNRALDLLAQATLDILAVLDPEGPPTEKVLALIRRHLGLEEPER